MNFINYLARHFIISYKYNELQRYGNATHIVSTEYQRTQTGYFLFRQDVSVIAVRAATPLAQTFELPGDG